MLNKNKMVIYISIIIQIIVSQICFADWIDPKDIITGSWGNNTNQFYFFSGDTDDFFPKEFGVNNRNEIFIADQGNRRVQVFNSNGKLKRIIPPPLEFNKLKSWPYEISVHLNGYFVVVCEGQRLFYNSKGDFIKKEKIIGEGYLGKEGYFFRYKEKEYILYSLTGQFLKTYDTRPLELGIVQEISLGGGNYENIIEYPDKKWKVKGLCAKYMQDACETLYCVDNAIVIRYDDKGKDVAFVGMPDEKIEQLPNPNPPGSGIDAPFNVLEQYGTPVLAPNGDVYTWKRTPDKYSIIKWVWVDGPECPQNLEVKPTANSLKFTWQKPLKDADKISYYQLLQSYNICGPFRQVNLIKKSQLSYEDRDVKKGETYYYVVKAMRGNEYSGNSNKVCGQLE